MMSQEILVADDSASVRRAVRTYLSVRNLHVCGEAENGLDAVEKAKELKPDLILLDLAMPGMNGLEAACVLKRQMPNVRTILFTMYSEAVSRTYKLKLSCVDEVIAKADGMARLVECVQRLLGTPPNTSAETLF